MSISDKIKTELAEQANAIFGIQSAPAPVLFQSETDTLTETKEKKEDEKSETSESSESSSSSSSSEKKLDESELAEVKLSASSLRSLANAYIAEAMIDEVITEDEDLSTYGLMVEGKLTEKGRALLKKYLPTIFAS